MPNKNFLKSIALLLTLILSGCQQDPSDSIDKSNTSFLSISDLNPKWESLDTTSYAFSYASDAYAISGISNIYFLKVFDHDEKLYLLMRYAFRDVNDDIKNDYRYYELGENRMSLIRSSPDNIRLNGPVPLTSQINGYWFRDGSLIECTFQQKNNYYAYRPALSTEFAPWYQYEIYPTAREGNLSGGERNFTNAKGLNSTYLATAYYIQNYIQTGDNTNREEYPVEYGIWLDDYSGANDKAIPFDTLIFRPFDRQYRRSLQFGALYEPRYFSTSIRVDQSGGNILALTSRDTAIREGGGTVRWNPSLFLSLGNQQDEAMKLLEEIPFQEKPRDPAKILQYFEQDGSFYILISYAFEKDFYRIYTVTPQGIVSHQDVSANQWKREGDPSIFIWDNKICTYDISSTSESTTAQVYEINAGGFTPIEDPIELQGYQTVLNFYSSGTRLYLFASINDVEYAACCPDAYFLEILRLK